MALETYAGNDYEQPVVDARGQPVDIDAAQDLQSPPVRADQPVPKR